VRSKIPLVEIELPTREGGGRERLHEGGEGGDALSDTLAR